MSEKISQWITVNGNHIPIFEGESKKQAVERFTARKSNVKNDTDVKNRQIEANKEEGKQLTRKEKEEAWNKKIDDVIKKHIDNTQIKAGKPTKNSDSIFKANFYSVSKDIKNGKTYDTLTSLYGYDKENEYINSKQTMSGIQYLINKRIEDAKTDFRIGVIDNTEFNQELKALKIIQNTLNRIKQEKKW